MKILDILNCDNESSDTILEMSEQEARACENNMRVFFRKYQIFPVITTHAFRDRFLNDDSRKNISGDDVFSAIVDSFEKYKEKITKYKQNKVEFVGVAHNKQNNVNVVYSIDYHRPASTDPRSGMRINNLKVITAIVSDNFKSDNFKSSVQMFI